MLANISRPTGPIKPLVPLRPSAAGPRSVGGQLWDLFTGLPQGIMGFGMDAAKDALVIPHVALDLIKNQGLSGGLKNYLPASSGVVQSIGHTVGDVVHPMNLVKAYKEGHIVSKLVEDVGNVAVVGGAAAKVLGAGAATAAMTAEEAAARGATRIAGGAVEAGGTSLADAAQFGGREVAEYTLPKKGLASLAERAGNPELAESLQKAGNIAKKISHYGERAGNVPALPYQYAGRAIDTLAERAGLEGGISGQIRSAATHFAPNIMFRNTEAGQVVRTATAEAEQLGTRATRFSLEADNLAKQLGLTETEGRAVGTSIDLPNLGKGIELLSKDELSNFLDRAYAGVEESQRPTIEDVRTAIAYRERTLPAEKLSAMDRVQDELINISRERTQRALGPVPAKLEPGTPAEPRAQRVLPDGTVETDAPWYRQDTGVEPGRTPTGVPRPTGLNPEQLGTELRPSKISEYQQQLERPRNLTARQAETAENTALREERITAATDALATRIPEAPQARVEFSKGIARERARSGDSIARRAHDAASRQLERAVNDYTKASEVGDQPAVQRAAREVDRLTGEVQRISGMLERNERRVDAYTGLSTASGDVERGAPRIADDTPSAYAMRQAEVQMEGTLNELQELNQRYGHSQVATPEISGVGNEPQRIRARAKEIAQREAYDANGAIESMTGGDRPKIPGAKDVGGEHDWWRGLDEATQRRLQREKWIRGAKESGASSEQMSEEIARKMGGDPRDIDMQMGRFVDAVRRYWDAKAGKSQAVIDQLATEMNMPADQIRGAITGKISDYGELLTDNVKQSFGELRDGFQQLDTEGRESFRSTAEAMLDDPNAEMGDFGDLLSSYFPDLDVNGQQGILSTLDGMADLPDVIDWMSGGKATDFPERLRAKMEARTNVQARQLGKLEGQTQGIRSLRTNAEVGLKRSEMALDNAEKSAQRTAETKARAVERASTAEEAKRPPQGPKLAETLRPDTEAADQYRRRTGTTRTGEKTAPMSPAERARWRQGAQAERSRAARAKADRLHRSVTTYNEKIANAQNELGRTFQDRLHNDVNVPAIKQMTNAVASGGKALGTIIGEGDTAALNGTIASLGDKYGMYDDLVERLDESRQALPKGETLSAGDVAATVDEVLRRRPDVVLSDTDKLMLDDAINRDSLLEDVNDTMLGEVDDGNRLNSPYRVWDTVNASKWKMPQEARNRIDAAWERFQTRRAATITKTYNQWTAAMPARFRTAAQAGQRQIGALLEMAEEANSKVAHSGDIYLDMAESTMNTLGKMVDDGINPEHLVGGRPASQSSAASSARGGGLTQPKLRGTSTRRTGLRQLSLDAYARVEAKEALDWVRGERNKHIESQLGVRADAVPEVQEALAQWAEDHHGETMPPRTLEKITDDAGFRQIEGKGVAPQTVLVPKQVFDALTPSEYNIPGLKALGRTNRAFKTWVLPFSPKWQIGNVLGNVIQSAVHGGVSPIELVSTMNRIRKYEGGIMELWRKSGLPDWTRPEIANHGLTIDEYRTLRGVDDVQPRTPIGKIARSSFRLNEFVDNLTRSATDLAALGRGESTDQALQTTIRSLGDYSRMSNFERKVVREVIPFYAWIRHSVTATLRLPIVSPARAAFLMHLSDVYSDPEMQTELLGSRIPFMGGLLNLGTVSPLADIRSLNPSSIGQNFAPAVKAISSIAFGFDPAKMAAITRPGDTKNVDAFGRQITTSPLARLVTNPLQGLGEIGWQLTQQAPTPIRVARDAILGDEVRYAGTGYQVGNLTDPKKRSLQQILRALNLPSVDPLPQPRS
jgi:hypothetical protein